MFIPVPLSYGTSSGGRSEVVTPDLNKNVYAEADPEADGKVYLVGTPGTSAAVTMTTNTGTHRQGGAIEHRGFLYVVVGDRLRRLDSSLTETAIGNLNTSSGAVSMAANKDYLMVVDGTDGYVYNFNTSTFSVISDVDFPASPVQVAYWSQYFIVIEDGGSKFYVSDVVNGPTSWEGLDFASKNKSGDILEAIFYDNEQLILLGERTGELWTLTGNADFPFETWQGGTFDKGCVSRFSVAKLDTSFAWLAQDKRGGYQVCTLAGQNTPVVISTASISKKIGDLTTPTDCFATTIIFEGNEFYALNFPTDNTTLVYNVVTKKWFEWPYWTGAAYEDNRMLWSVFFNNKHYVGRRGSLVVDELNSSYYDNAGTAIKREFTCEYIEDDKERISLREVYLVTEQAVGNASVANPTIELLVSKDSGKNFTSFGTRSLGTSSEPNKRTIWRVALQGRTLLFKFVMTDAAKLVVKKLLIKPRSDMEYKKK